MCVITPLSFCCNNNLSSNRHRRYPETNLPSLVHQVVDAIIDHEGAAESAEVAAWEATEEYPISK